MMEEEQVSSTGTAETQSKGNPPVDHLRQGNLEAAIWANTTEKGTFYSATFVRKYQVEDEWKQSSSFNERDLPGLAKLMNDTHSRIQELRGAGTSN